MPELFSDGGWDGSLDDLEITEEPAAEQATEEVAAVEEPAVEAAQEEAPEAVTDDRERDELGRFVPKKIEVDDPDVAAYLNKYGGDPIKALQAATEAQRTIGSLNNELGQLRPLADKLEQIEQRLATPQAPQQVITRDLIENDPALATQLAYEQNNQVALQQAFAEWKEYAPADAVAWAFTQRMEQQNQQWEQRFQQVQAQYAPLAESQENQAFAAEVRALGPEAIQQITDGAQSLDPQVSQFILSRLESGTPDEKIGALKALTALTSQGRGSAPATPDDVRNLARETALAADQAIAEAAVVSATATRSETPKQLADRIGDEWDALERPLSDGWNIG